MSTTAKFVKDLQKKPKYTTRKKNRCHLCGRPKGYIRMFGLCRLCFLKLARKGELPGVTKASW